MWVLEGEKSTYQDKVGQGRPRDSKRLSRAPQMYFYTGRKVSTLKLLNIFDAYCVL